MSAKQDLGALSAALCAHIKEWKVKSSSIVDVLNDHYGQNFASIDPSGNFVALRDRGDGARFWLQEIWFDDMFCERFRVYTGPRNPAEIALSCREVLCGDMEHAINAFYRIP